MPDYPVPDPLLTFDYGQTSQNFRALAEIRFKLLALVPALSGAAIALLAEKIQGRDAAIQPEAILVVGLLGFCVTLGVTFDNLRNSQISYAVFLRLQMLERALYMPARDSSPKPGGQHGGQYREGPGPSLWFFALFKICHKSALAMVYGTVLGAWLFPIAYAGLQLSRAATERNLLVAVGVAAVGTLGFVLELHRLNNVVPTKLAKQPETQTPEDNPETSKSR